MRLSAKAPLGALGALALGELVGGTHALAETLALGGALATTLVDRALCRRAWERHQLVHVADDEHDDDHGMKGEGVLADDVSNLRADPGVPQGRLIRHLAIEIGLSLL